MTCHDFQHRFNVIKDRFTLVIEHMRGHLVLLS